MRHSLNIITQKIWRTLIAKKEVINMDIRIRRINNGYLVTAGFMDGLEWYFKRFDDAIEV